MFSTECSWAWEGGGCSGAGWLISKWWVFGSIMILFCYTLPVSHSVSERKDTCDTRCSASTYIRCRNICYEICNLFGAVCKICAVENWCFITLHNPCLLKWPYLSCGGQDCMKIIPDKNGCPLGCEQQAVRLLKAQSQTLQFFLSVCMCNMLLYLWLQFQVEDGHLDLVGTWVSAGVSPLWPDRWRVDEVRQG